jgi:antitoxin (DNA-binding transcriptional repressor) of toxin-antitoxin stability system
MAVTVNMHEAKTELSRLVAQALAGEEAIIARAGVPAVRLTPLRQSRIPGSAKGEMKIASTFDDPLPGDVVTTFGGPPARKRTGYVNEAP